MKIAPLLAQFLYTHHRLDLPGIGSFKLEASSTGDAEPVRQGKPVLLEGVSFDYDNTAKQSPDLVAFIASQTGKIRALASADLESHLELAKQFLNIGKPFLFEGIGSLTKMQGGGFSFHPGHMLVAEKGKEAPAVREPSSPVAAEEASGDYSSIFYAKKTKTNWKRPLTVLLLLGGIVLAVWGGYKIYKKTTAKRQHKTETEQTNTASTTTLLPDTTAGQVKPSDTLQTSAPAAANTAAPVPAGNYKFVVEVANRERALTRYTNLQKMGVKTVQMETSDSVTFKLFFIMPATPETADSIKNMLKRIYNPKGDVYVEVNK